MCFLPSESATFDWHLSPVAWGNLGNVLKNQGKMAEAERAYRNALHHRGNMADMLYNLWVLKIWVPATPLFAKKSLDTERVLIPPIHQLEIAAAEQERQNDGARVTDSENLKKLKQK